MALGRVKFAAWPPAQPAVVRVITTITVMRPLRHTARPLVLFRPM
jgi:hypothetical protein